MIARFVQRHPDGVALALAVLAGFLFCLAVVWIGTSAGIGQS